MTKYNEPTELELSLPVWTKSGLTSEFTFKWQEDIRWMSNEIVGCWFDPSDSGYEYWKECGQWLIDNKVQDQVILGHSNGNIFATRIAKMLAPHGLRVRICCIDRTMGYCPPLGENVPNAIDLWAGPPMRRLKVTQDFIKAGNELERTPTYRHESHLSILKNPEVRRRAIEFCKKWKRDG